jgi:hypothetical protein
MEQHSLPDWRRATLANPPISTKDDDTLTSQDIKEEIDKPDSPIDVDVINLKNTRSESIPVQRKASKLPTSYFTGSVISLDQFLEQKQKAELLIEQGVLGNQHSPSPKKGIFLDFNIIFFLTNDVIDYLRKTLPTHKELENERKDLEEQAKIIRFKEQTEEFHGPSNVPHNFQVLKFGRFSLKFR